MPPSLEVVMPVRNPGEVFTRTIDSLLAQTDRQFTVLLSDNYSTTGTERLAEAARRLAEGGLAARVIRPPWELGRVQHWNWLHHQSEADWLKPLFVGDWLEPDCFAACREILAADPALRFLFFYFRYHRGEEEPVLCDCGGLAGKLDPAPLPERAIFEGNFAGGPVNTLYHRDAFQALGGHHTSLPLMADFDLYTRLAMQVPTYALPRALGHFMLHENRFAKKGSGERRESMNTEWFLEASLLAYAALGAGRPIPMRRLAPRLFQLLVSCGKEWFMQNLGRAKRKWQ